MQFLFQLFFFVEKISIYLLNGFLYAICVSKDISYIIVVWVQLTHLIILATVEEGGSGTRDEERRFIKTSMVM